MLLVSEKETTSPHTPPSLETELTRGANREDYAGLLQEMMEKGAISGKSKDALFYALHLERSGRNPCTLSPQVLSQILQTHETMHRAHCIDPYDED